MITAEQTVIDFYREKVLVPFFCRCGQNGITVHMSDSEEIIEFLSNSSIGSQSLAKDSNGNQYFLIRIDKRSYKIQQGEEDFIPNINVE